jgi:hypothetical protein
MYKLFINGKHIDTDSWTKLSNWLRLDCHLKLTVVQCDELKDEGELYAGDMYLQLKSR